MANAINDDFGAGVFEESATTAQAEEGGDEIVLTDREIALAEGRDPDAPDDATEEDDSQDDASTGEVAPADTEDEAEPEPQAEIKWSDSDKRLASMYGLTDEQIEKFDSPKSLHAAIDLLEESKASGTKADDEENDADGSALASDAANKSGAVSEVLGFAKVDVESVKKKFEEKDEDGEYLYDEGTRDFITSQAEALRKTQDLLEQRLSADQQRTIEAEQENNRKTFHDVLDSIPGVYGESSKNGKPVELNKMQLAAREEVAEHVQTIYAGIVSRGADIPPLKTLIEQSINAIHADRVAKNGSRAKKLSEQSRARRSPGTKAGAAKKQRKYDADDAESIANDPEIVAFFENAQFENGMK